MKYAKLQTDLVKMADKRDRGAGKRLTRIAYGNYHDETGDQIGIMVNGFYLLFIREDMRYIDLEKVSGNASPLTQESFNRMIKDPLDALEATDTNTVKSVTIRPIGSYKVRIFETEKDSEIWIDEKNLKYFDLDNSTFKGTDRNGPIYIYEADPINRLVGYVLPI